MKTTKLLFCKRSLLAYVIFSSSIAYANEWAGSYVGGSVGYGRLHAKTESVGTPGTGSVLLGGADAPATLARSLTGKYFSNPDGASVSARIGHNWQKARQVYGVEADLHMAPLKDTSSIRALTPFAGFPANPLSIELRQKSSIEQMATFRGRLGIAEGDWLFFGSAGLAVARVKTKVNYAGKFLTSPNTLPIDENSASSDTRLGFILGAGFDYALSKNWSLRTEYSYFDLGKTTQTYKVTSNALLGYFADATASATTKWAGSLLTVGLNYRF